MEITPVALNAMPQMVEFLKSSLQSHKEHIACEVRTAVFNDLQAFFASGLDTLHKTIRDSMENLELKVDLSLKNLESRVCVLEASCEAMKNEIGRICSLVSDCTKDLSEAKGKVSVNEAMLLRNYQDIKNLENFQCKVYEIFQELKSTPTPATPSYQNNCEGLFHKVDIIEAKLKTLEETNSKITSLEFNILKKDDPRFEQINSDVRKNTCDLQTLRNRFERVEIQISDR